jgi:rhodanese-related sulfurtransferase
MMVGTSTRSIASYQECPVSRSRPLALAALALAAVFVVSACGSTGGEAPGVREVAAAEAVQMLEARTVIDVRTPEEFASGHVTGAVNIPVEAADFSDRIGELDPKASYLVYCRSGRRSAIAADIMDEAGFTDVVDAGGLQPLADAGAPVE